MGTTTRGGSARRLLGGYGTRRLRLVLAGVLAAAAVPVAVMERPTTRVLVAVGDLPSGHVLSETDITSRALPAHALPDGTVTDPVALIGGRLSGAVRRGEVLTDAGLTRLHPGAAPEGSRVVPVTTADLAVAGLVSPGDLVDIIVPGPGTPTGPGSIPAPPGARTAPAPAEILAAGALVVEVTAPDRTRPGSARTVLVRLPGELAARVAARGVDSSLALTVHG